jgi:hypothetical protein
MFGPGVSTMPRAMAAKAIRLAVSGMGVLWSGFPDC